MTDLTNERAAFEAWWNTGDNARVAVNKIWTEEACWFTWQARATARQQATPIKPESKLVTFDEFVRYGIDHSANIVNGMPWSFIFNGHAVTHENDDLYLIGTPSIEFRRGEVLVATAFGDSRLIQVLQPPAPQATVKGDERAAWLEELNALVFEYGNAVLVEGSASRIRHIKRIMDHARAAVPQASTLTGEQREAIVTALRHLPTPEVDARYALTWLLTKGD